MATDQGGGRVEFSTPEAVPEKGTFPYSVTLKNETGAALPAAAVSAWIDWKGLRIDVETQNASMDTIEHLVRVGIALAGRYRRHATTPGVTVFMSTQPGPSQV